MVINTLADGVLRSVEAVTDTVSGTFFEPVIRLGVTGLARSGKTVFITSLVANLMDRGRMPGLVAAAEGRLLTAYLQPQPDNTVPRFDYEAHLGDLTSRSPHWPESTRAVSELRLSLKVQPGGLLSGLQGPRVIHLDIVDYPGEWLLDLALLDKSYAEWSEEVMQRIKGRSEAADFLVLSGQTDATQPAGEPVAKALSASFTTYLNAARDAGYYDCTPGRFLLPGDLAGAPVLTFAPLPQPEETPRKALWREMERRYEAYKREVVKPFFRDHFARIDRQVVLVDALGAIHKGPQAVEDMRHAMADILSAFRPGRNDFLTRLLMGKRVEKILFAATKADHPAPRPAPPADRDHGGADPRRPRPGALCRRRYGGDVDRGVARHHRTDPRPQGPQPRLRARRAARRRPAGGLLPRRTAGGSERPARPGARRRRALARRRFPGDALRPGAADTQTRRRPAPHPD